MTNPLNEPFFQIVFNQLPEPRIIIKADSPRFTIVAHNDRYQTVSNTAGKDIIGKSIWEIHKLINENSEGDIIIENALNKAIESNEVVKLSAVRYDLPSMDGLKTEQSWWQAEYIPISGTQGRVEYLICTTYNITEQVIGREAAARVQQQQQALQREQTLNEKLAAANKKLNKLNQELQHWQQALSIMINELEERVANRTKLLAESEARARYMLADAPVAIGVFTGHELIIETANEKILEVWGKSSAIIGKPLHLALPELNGQPFLQVLNEVFTTGRPYYGTEVKALFERNHVLEETYFNFVYHPLKDAEQRTTSIMVVANEVTEKVKAIKELEKAQDMLQLAMEASGIATWSADLSNKELIFSKSAFILHGIPVGTGLTLMDAMQLMLPEYRGQFRAAVEEALKNKVSFNEEYQIMPMDGSKPKWLKSTGKAYYQDKGKGKPLYMTGTMLDITENKLDDLRKNDFIAMASHELKTPLTVLKAYVQMLTIRVKKSEDLFIMAALEKVNAQVKKMVSMINSFLNVSRLEAGKIRLEKTTFNLVELINEMVKELVLTTKNYDIHLRPGQEISVFADREKIGQVIDNLLSNAVKYSPVGKQIEISSYQANGFAWISVKDQGIGVKLQDKGKLFERFYRVENPNMQTVSGFGIGLYLCAEIVQRHNGKIGVESEFGKGSTFWFTLPVN